MYTGRTIFSQLMDFLPKHDLHKCVRRYAGNYRIKSFSCLDQFLTNNFELPAVTVAQLYKARRRVEFFQMDQTAFANQSVLRNRQKRRENTNLDRSICVSTGRD